MECQTVVGTVDNPNSAVANRLPPGTPDVLKLVDFSHAEPTTGVPILSELAAIRVYVNYKQKLAPLKRFVFQALAGQDWLPELLRHKIEKGSIE